MNSSTQAKSHIEYMESLKKLWLFSNFILDSNLEDRFVSYLLEIKEDELFENLPITASNLIKQYQITEDDIRLHLNEMIPV